MRAKPVGGAGREALVPAPKARTSFPLPGSVEHNDRPRSESGARFRRMSLLGLVMILPPRIKRHSTIGFFERTRRPRATRSAAIEMTRARPMEATSNGVGSL
jgi:hypothetical protein